MDKFLIAAVFGPVLIIMGLYTILKAARSCCGSQCGSQEMRCGDSSKCCHKCSKAFVLLVIGMAIISTYNVWMWNMALLVTLLGWVFLIKGIGILFCPKVCCCSWLKSQPALLIRGVISIAWGIALTYFAHA